MANAPLTIVILTKNEEANIARCLERVAGWADEVIVVLDSGSTDRTSEISRVAGAKVVEHSFQGFVEQRNWALRELPVRNEWVLFVDADEYPTEELKEEISKITNYQLPITNPTNMGKSNFPRKFDFQNIDGFYINRRFIWEGRWIRHGGYYPVWILRLMRRSAARCEGQLMDEHFVVDGATGRLSHDLVHDDRRGLTDWKAKHRRYAVLKAREYVGKIKSQKSNLKNTESGSSITDAERRRRAGRRSAYNRLPLFLRAVLYFGYIFFLQGGFLDGPKGWHFHVLRGLWYPLLIDREIVRLRRSMQ